MTVAEALASTATRLEAAGCDSPTFDAEVIVAHVLDTTRGELRLDGSRELSAVEAASLEQLVTRREAREPLAYVVGEWGFRRLVLNVDRRVLAPRPETEIVVERCLARLRGIDDPRVLDVGTGSGAIALAIADEHPRSRVTALDASAAALEVADSNVTRTGVAIDLLEWDLRTGLPDGPWSLVVANPPYVLPEEIDALEPEVRDWEPREALVGVGATEAVARGAREVLEPGGVIVLEVATAAADRIAALLGALGYVDVAITRDLAGRDRVVEGTSPE